MTALFNNAGTIVISNIVLTTLSHLRYYLVSINLNYLYNFGFLLGVSIFLQTISGLFLTLIYYTQLQLYSNIYVMTYDYYYGYLYRNVHILLATIVNILLLVHIFKGLLYNNLSNQIYIHYSGYILYLLLIVISYLGYILTYGQLSYWGATVIINLLPSSLATLILGDYNISSITINRYLIFHIILTLILYVFIIIHIFYLHQLSSQSPLPVSILSSPSSQLSISFHHFILKDLTSVLFLITIFLSIALFILINLSHSMNLIPINPLSTPSHIVPEWYFLYLYSILKIIPSKMGGILTVVITILIILLLTTSNYSYNVIGNSNSLAIANYNSIDTVMTIFLSYIYLSYIGLQLPIAPYLINLRYFLLYLPIPIIMISLLSTLPLASMGRPFNTFLVSLKLHLRPLTNLGIFRRVLQLIQRASGQNLVRMNYISLISTTNHKRIGLYYLLTGAYIAILGIILSIIIRVELYCPDNNIINMSNVSFYNYTITNHGLLMLLFIVMPIIFGAYGNYLLVLTVGLIDIIFPRINNFGWLLLVLSYVLIQFGILTEYLTGTGWTLYPPLSTITSTYLISTIFLALAISGVSSLLTSVNYMLLIPYLLHVSDLLLISFLITALMILYTMPVLAGAFLLATSDILLSTSYFSNYGDPVLYQHAFWWFSCTIQQTRPRKTLPYAGITSSNLLVHVLLYLPSVGTLALAVCLHRSRPFVRGSFIGIISSTKSSSLVIASVLSRESKHFRSFLICLVEIVSRSVILYLCSLNILSSTSNMTCYNLISYRPGSFKSKSSGDNNRRISREVNLNKLRRRVNHLFMKRGKGYKYVPHDEKSLFKALAFLRDYAQGNMYYNNRTDYNHPFYWWLAGFIEGDGCMTYSSSGNKRYPRLKIELGIKDIKTIHLLKRILGIGKIYYNIRQTRTPCAQFVIYRQEHVLYLINILQGKVLLKNKQITYASWVTMYNTCYNTTLLASYLNWDTEISIIKNQLLNTSWLSGLIDAEGCFSISVKERVSGGYSYIHNFYLGNKDELSLYQLLTLLLQYNKKKKLDIRKNGVVLINLCQTIRKPMKYNTFLVLLKYLKYHPLKSRKRLAFNYWFKCYQLLLSGRAQSSRRGHNRLVNAYKSLRKVNSRLKPEIPQIAKPSDSPQESA